jgi:type I restriction enzyme M protein
MFYNTGIATYIWVISYSKPEHRKGRVQRHAVVQTAAQDLGKKNCELSEENIQRTCDAFLAFEETEQSKVFDNKAFGNWKVTVERPLRLRVDLEEASRALFRKSCDEADESPLANVVDRVAAATGPGPHLDFNVFMSAVVDDSKQYNVKLNSKRRKLLKDVLATRDENSIEVIKRILKKDAERDPIRRRFETTIAGKPAVVEYEAATELRDTEQVALLVKGGIEVFIRLEILPYAADAWYDGESVKIWLRDKLHIVALEHETEGLLSEIIGGEH